MGEKLTSEKRQDKKGELESSKESLDRRSSEQLKKIEKSTEKKASKANHEHKKNLEKIRSSIDRESLDKRNHKDIKGETEKSDNDQSMLINQEIKSIAYKRTLKKTQAKLSPASRTFSKIIHQPTVEKISEVAGNTIARPSGILFGGILSFIGSAVFLWTARHYGYEYNFLLFLIFFTGGFFLGLILELLFRLLKANKN